MDSNRSPTNSTMKNQTTTQYSKKQQSDEEEEDDFTYIKAISEKYTSDDSHSKSKRNDQRGKPPIPPPLPPPPPWSANVKLFKVPPPPSLLCESEAVQGDSHSKSKRNDQRGKHAYKPLSWNVKLFKNPDEALGEANRKKQAIKQSAPILNERAFGQAVHEVVNKNMGSIPAANDLEKGKAEEDKAFTIWEVDEALLASKIKKFTWQLKEYAGGASCSIFRIPQSLAEVRPMDYQPHIASIGPYHHGQDRLQMMDQHKWRFLNDLIGRSKMENGKGLADYLHAMETLEADARECYSEIIGLDSKTFVEMMLLDSCFIVELFRKFGREIVVAGDDPIFLMPWVLPFLTRDLLRLENQIPFFVIQKVFDLSVDNKKSSSLVALALKMFSAYIYRPDEVISRCQNLPSQPKHLLDLFRSSFIPPHLKEPEEDNKSAQIIPRVSKLLRAGIKFKTIKTESFLMINFKKGTLEIPKLTINEFFSSFLQNCIAYEQSHRYCSLYITTFATFLDFLIDTEKDVGLLCDEKIIENYIGSDEEVATFFNQLGRNVIFNMETCYLAKEYVEVNEYYRNSWNVKYAEFKSTYFSSTWSFMASMAALILLIVTVTQTFFTIFPYYNPRGK